MTCLVAIKHSRGVVLGADSSVSFGAVTTRSVKLLRKGKVWLALAGSDDELGTMLDRMSDRADPADLGRWLRRCGPEGSGFAWAPRSGQLLEWGSAVSEVLDYSAAGSGWEIALGAIHAMRAQGASPVATAVAALRAAAAHRGDVGGPFPVVRLPAGTVKVYK